MDPTRSEKDGEHAPAQHPQMPGRRSLLLGTGALGTVLLGAAAGESQANSPQTPTAAPEQGTVWWAELVASDLGKAAGFYSSVIGWSTHLGALSDSSRPPAAGEPALLLFKSDDNAVAGGLLADPKTPGKTAPRWIVYFQVDNVDAAIARTLAKGGALLIHPFEVASTVRLAVVADPDGTPFGLATPL